MKKLIIAAVLFLAAALVAAEVRFVDNGDGTVIDNGTGLMWQKCSDGQNAVDCSGTAASVTWQQALVYCKNLSLLGRSWRLPSVNELGSIVEYSAYGPSINTAFFPDTVSYPYWSSSTNVYGPFTAWSVNFSFGLVATYHKSNNHYVRCVTDGP